MHRIRVGLVLSGAVLAAMGLTGSALAAAVDTTPVARDDSYSTGENQNLIIGAPGVLANDTDADGDVLNAVYVSGPQHGTVSLSANGAFTYVPTTNYVGPDQFTYKACDPATVPTLAPVPPAVTAPTSTPAAPAVTIPSIPPVIPSSSIPAPTVEAPVGNRAFTQPLCDTATVFITVKPGAVIPPATTPPPGRVVFYANCTIALDAVGHPLVFGVDAGYRIGLDRDQDGIACEVNEGNPPAAIGILTCQQLKDRGLALPIPRGSVWYRGYLDANHNGLACEIIDAPPPPSVINNTTINNPPPVNNTIVNPPATSGPSNVFIVPPAPSGPGFSQIQQPPAGAVQTGDGSSLLR